MPTATPPGSRGDNLRAGNGSSGVASRGSSAAVVHVRVVLDRGGNGACTPMLSR